MWLKGCNRKEKSMLGRLRGGLYDGGDKIGSTLGESLALTNDNSFVKKRKHVPFLQINRVHAWKF